MKCLIRPMQSVKLESAVRRVHWGSDHLSRSTIRGPAWRSVFLGVPHSLHPRWVSPVLESFHL